jgi:DNA-binding SARP family transcriptional activator
VRFEILGPLRVCAGTGEVTVTAGRDRVLLAMLLLHPDSLVSVDQLVEAIWEGDPPARARNQVQKCVLQLRRLLADAGHAQEVIRTEPAGYRLITDSVSVDLLEFRALVAEARAAAVHHDQLQARDRYRQALALWSGVALAGFHHGPVRQGAAALNEQRRQVQTEMIEVELALGGAGELVAELVDLVYTYPYEENLRQALMLALYRAGRQADALAAYQQARTLLVSELGQEPGPALQELHRRILTGDTTLLDTANGGPTVHGHGAPAAARRCLPPAVGDFTGRRADLTWLLATAERAGDTTHVVALDGMAGIGKTTLALHAAHLLASRYPDAQLFVDLHGHSERRPVEPAAALDVLLRQLGVPSARIPTDLDERVALWRSEIAARRALVVLDNAATAAQVRPLLPAAAGSLTLVTSRRRLVGLDAAAPLSLQVLGDDEGVALLARVAGDRVRDEPETAAEVVRHCGNLPLAIRLAGARLAHRPSWRVRDLADRLTDAGHLLGELAAEDRTVADALALSYAPLHADQQRVFRLLGLHPGEHFDEYATAALADISLDESRKALEELVDRHLLLEPEPGRYRFHDLVREYARQLAEATDSEADRRTAIENLLDYYLYATAATASLLEAPDKRQRLRFGEPNRGDLVAVVAVQGPAWLERERRNLIPLIRHAGAIGQDDYTWKLARSAWAYFYELNYFDDLLTAHHLGLDAAIRIGEEHIAATMHNYLASGYFRIGEVTVAIDHLQATISFRDRSNDKQGAIAARMNLANVLTVCGEFREAAALQEMVLAARQRAGNVSAIGSALSNLANTYIAMGRYQEALTYHRRCLAIMREVGNLLTLARSLGHIGIVRLRQGEARVAIRLFIAALRLKRRIGGRDGEGEILSELGNAYRALGDHHRAIAWHVEAVTLVEATGDRPVAGMARNDYGRTLLEAGDLDGALEQHRSALAIALKIKMKYEQARALDGIAACLRDTDPEEARRHWQQALALYTEMGTPEQHEVTRWLAALDETHPS